jgi:hypothetical protein
MDKPIYCLKTLNNLLKKVSDNIDRLEQRLTNAPEGTIETRVQKGKHRFFKCVKGKPDEYLGKERDNEIKALIQKKLDLELLKISQREKRALEKAILQVGPKTKEQVWNEFPEVFKSYIKTDESIKVGYIQKWLDQWPLTQQDEEHVFLTDKGDYVRSKSEYIIANLLYKSKIPYRYEFPLILEHGLFRYFPDFTILHPYTLKTIYWEHFGMMDKEDYFTDTKEKLEVYTEYGFFLGEQMILTFESAKSPLNIKHVIRLINKYFS